MATDTIELRPQPRQETFLASEADIAIYGGAAGGGKTWSILLEPLRHIDNPEFRCLILRKTFSQIDNPGGLWDAAESIYPLLGAEMRRSKMKVEFPSGAEIHFGHLQHEKNKHDYQGAEIPLIQFDELVHFAESEFWYLLSRNRSMSGVAPYIRATCNPDADSWVARFIDWYIGEDGYPIAERSGVVRWFVRVSGEVAWGNDKAALESQYPGTQAKSFTFVSSTLEDNPHLMKHSPEYRASLLALPTVERERLLWGNWKIRDDGQSLLTWELIRQNTDKRCLWKGGKKPENEHTRSELYMGVDFGFTQDRFVIWLAELQGDIAITRDVFVADKLPEDRMRAEIKNRLNSSVVRCMLDQGAQGYMIAHEFARNYPAKCQAVQLTQGRQGQLGMEIQQRFEQHKIRIPTDDRCPDLSADLMRVQVAETVNGLPVIKTERGPEGHGDRFWAMALALSGMPDRQSKGVGVKVRRNNIVRVR